MKHRMMRAELRAWVATKALICTGEWNSADPLFVRLTFVEGDRSVTWDVPREGLVTGMPLAEGGDMGIFRDLVHDVVVITFIGHDPDTGADLRAEISIAALALDGWLHETDTVLPIGTEARDLDWSQLANSPAESQPEIPESDLLGECRVCLAGTEARKYLDFTNAGSCPLCGRSLR